MIEKRKRKKGKAKHRLEKEDGGPAQSRESRRDSQQVVQEQEEPERRHSVGWTGRQYRAARRGKANTDNGVSWDRCYVQWETRVSVGESSTWRVACGFLTSIDSVLDAKCI